MIKLSSDSHKLQHLFLTVFLAVVLVGAGVVVGILIKGEDNAHTAGEPLKATDIGNPSIGRELLVEKGCTSCHTFEGKGGTDAPPLDFMKGRLSAIDIASMSGRIWNHVPDMEVAFKKEGKEFPTFKGNEMADMMAYLHGGGSPPDVKKGETHMGEEDEDGDMKKGEDKGKDKGDMN